ncbi:MAG: ATP-binding protein, partial [Ignavibacteria bacterium]
MNSAKIDFLSKYNRLVTSSLSSAKEFPDKLCEFLVNEYEFEAVVLALKTGKSNFTVLGKSTNARKSFAADTSVNCDKCSHIDENETDTKFEIQQDCRFTVSDVVMNEGCLHINISENEKVILKIAEKGEFNKNEIDKIIVIGDSLRNLLQLWMKKKGSLNSPVGKIISSIAHELRTPTNSILGFASLLNEENLSSSQREYVDTLKDNAYDLLSILNDLIDIAKLDIEETKSVLSDVNISQFVQEIIRLIEEKIDKTRLDIITNIEDNLPASFNLDAPKLRYILLNTINNAVRLTEDGKITISAFSTEKNKLNFRITDTSAGISSDKIKDVYTPFALNDYVVQKIGNTTGLGLSLVKRYIDHMNGEIDITSTVGKGTSYYLSIPVEETLESKSKTASTQEVVQTNKILVIEDDYATSKLLSNYLQKWGYEPTIVNSAKQTFEIIEKETFLAILMDIFLPDSNGLELLQNLRKLPQTRKT